MRTIPTKTIAIAKSRYDEVENIILLSICEQSGKMNATDRRA